MRCGYTEDEILICRRLHVRQRRSRMRSKTFDCVRMKREGAERVMRQLEGKSRREQLEFWRKGTEDLRRLQQRLRAARTGG